MCQGQIIQDIKNQMHAQKKFAAKKKQQIKNILWQYNIMNSFHAHISTYIIKLKDTKYKEQSFLFTLLIIMHFIFFIFRKRI